MSDQAPGETHVSTLRLLTSPRFWPLFWAMFLGAFNDNLIKNAAILLITYSGLKVLGEPAENASTVGTAMLILPAILLAAMAGQLADRYSKSNLLRPIKLAEIGLMVVAGIGFLFHMPDLLMVVILGLGIQSTFLGPLKYSILPQLLTDTELVAGNALVETGTNLAILTGSVLAGFLIRDRVHGLQSVSGALLAVSVLGYWCSRKLVPTEAQAPDLKVEPNPVVSTWEISRAVYRTPTIFRAILGISWFWVYGVALVTLFVPYTEDVIHGDETVQTLFLALFSIGVGLGSILCEKLSFDRLELGLIPIGSVGMTVFLFDLCRSWHGNAVFDGHYLDWLDLLRARDGSHVTFNMAMIAMFSGFYIVPLYTFIQARAEASVRSRVVAANNIINSLFIALWAAIQIILLKFYSPIHVLMILAILNIVVAFYIYTVIPEFTIRFVIYLLVHLVYRVRAKNLGYIPHEGAAVLVCNHVTFVDWFIISGLVRRPIRFTMYRGYSNLPILRIFMRQARVIPLASHKEDPALLERAMDRVAEELSLGELVCIFPEGALTKDGDIAQFRKGIERIVQRTPVPVIPMALQGLWGSFFSRKDGQQFRRPFHHGVWSHVGLVAGPPVAPADVTADGLRETVLQLRGDQA